MSVVCGCSVAAGAGSAAGMVSLMGGNAPDGGWRSCSSPGHVSTEQGRAVRQGELWLDRGIFCCQMGIMDKTGIPQEFSRSLEQTIENVTVTREGMKTWTGS